ncbi:MAG TPA: Gfo/Idh/MocA family oxidoreductase [Rubrivivax sp.]
MLRFAAIGLEHRHIYDLVAELVAAGAQCAGYCPETTDPHVLKGFRDRFPQLQAVERRRLIEDPSIDIVCCAAIPEDRAGIAIDAMRHGKDVLVDKPGVTSAADLAALRACVTETGRIFSICFSERFLVPAVQVAARLVAQGEIGRVVQTTGLGPHRLNRAIRPAWFFKPRRFGGILVDIGSHQIDQFLFFTGAADAQIVASSVANHAMPDVPDFEDFGEILLRSGAASGFVRVDWFTPESLPTWGDGRLVLLGTEGYIELRKYVDVAGRPGTDHVFVSNRAGTRHIDASAEPLNYFTRFLADVHDRTQTAMAQSHVFTVCRLALEAQARAVCLSAPSR